MSNTNTPAILRHEATDETANKTQTLQNAANYLVELSDERAAYNPDVARMLVKALQAKEAAYRMTKQACLSTSPT